MNHTSYLSKQAKNGQSMLFTDQEGNLGVVLYYIRKEEVIQKDLTRISQFFRDINRLYGTSARQRLILGVNGYDDTQDELYEIPEVKEFMKKLIDYHPELFYFINTDNPTGWYWIVNCYFGFEKIFDKQSHSILMEYGLNIDKLPVIAKQTFNPNDVKWQWLFKAVLRYGKKINDIEGSIQVVSYYKSVLNIL